MTLCSGRSVQAHRRGRSQVQALGAAVDRHPHPRVGRRRRAPAGRPCASEPNSHAVGAASRPASASSSRSLGAVRVGREHREAGRPQLATTAAAAAPPRTTSTWNRLPALARTHLPLYGSTAPSGEDHRRRRRPRRRCAAPCRRCPGRGSRRAPRPAPGRRRSTAPRSRVQVPADRDHALRRDGLGQRGQAGVGHRADPDVGSVGRHDQVGVTASYASAVPNSSTTHAGGQRLAHRLRAFGQEPAGLVAVRAGAAGAEQRRPGATALGERVRPGSGRRR